MTAADPSALPLEIDVATVRRLLAGPGRIRLIDCREPDEFAAGHVDGAELMPLSRFAFEAAAKLPDVGQRIVVYCQHGRRSLRCVDYLVKRGYRDAHGMAGGFAVWTGTGTGAGG